MFAMEDPLEEEPAGLPDQELTAAFARVHREWLALSASRLRFLVEIERRKSYRHEGYLSAQAWMADRLGEASAEAKRDVKVAVALEQMPVVREAVAAGTVSIAAAGVL